MLMKEGGGGGGGGGGNGGREEGGGSARRSTGWKFGFHISLLTLSGAPAFLGVSFLLCLRAFASTQPVCWESEGGEAPAQCQARSRGSAVPLPSFSLTQVQPGGAEGQNSLAPLGAPIVLLHIQREEGEGSEALGTLCGPETSLRP